MSEDHGHKKPQLARNYDRAAWFYEASSTIFSLGQIQASKRYQLQFMKPGDNVLYLGVGAGEDALLAARTGANVTCVDISQGMLDRLQLKLENENLEIELICQSAFDHDRTEYYDICATNYFLNVFRPDDMARMLHHAATLVRPGGKFLIADVAVPQGNPLARAFTFIYLKSAMLSFWLIGLVPLHENYDYPALFADANLSLEHVELFRLAKFGPVAYQSIVGRKL